MAEKVLIVDDDVQTLRLVGLMLERHGFTILAANNGEQAINMARAEHPDVVILDVMMPDIDGYEVTRRLRKDPETAHLLILLFTAKTQVDDKISGYEAGADDYLTKPVHPAELIAHMHALLARNKLRGAPSVERGYTIGVLAAKGGLGVSSIALNLAIAYHQKTKAEIIAAELRPGQGSWGLELSSNQTDGLANLLRLSPVGILPAVVEKELVRLPYGVRLLMASARTKETELMNAVKQMEVVLDVLPMLSRVTILDIGTNFHPAFDAVLKYCNEVIAVIEPFPACMPRTRLLIEDLNNRGFGRTKLLTLVSNNRIRADIQLSMIQMQELLGMPVSHIFPPAPETAYQAANRSVPLIQVQIGGSLSQQFSSLAEKLSQRIPV